MATVVLGAVGAGIGAAFGDPQLGFSVGVLLAGALFPPKSGAQERGRLDDLRVTGSAYGSPIPQIFGKMRVGGNVIWVQKDANGNHLVEHKQTHKNKSGSITDYTYSASFAVSICRGPIGRVVRIWGEDRLIYDASAGGADDEIQQISIGTNTGGSYTISFGGVTSASIDHLADAATIQSTLEAMSSIGVGNILVTGATPTYLCTFTGALAGQNVARMDMSNHTLTGGSGEGITTVQQGGTTFTIRTYLGTETQTADSLIVAAEGASNSPAYRGTAYAVFENLDLSVWGNRIPSLTFEVDAGDGVTTYVSDILTNLFTQAGLVSSQWDVSAVTALAYNGFVLAQRQELRQQIQPLLQAYYLDLTEVDGKIKVLVRGGASAATVPATDLGAYIWAGSAQPNPKVKSKRMQDIELPQRLDVTYFSSTNVYNQASQGAVRVTKGYVQNAVTINTPLVFAEQEARQRAETLLYQQWIERSSFDFILPFKYIQYTPGDILELPVGSSTLRVRIVSQDIPLVFGPIAMSAVLDNASVLTQTTAADAVQSTTSITQVVDSVLTAWTGNALTNDDADSIGLYFVVAGDATGDWPGCVVYVSKDGGTSYQLLQTVVDSGDYGYASSVLAAGDSFGTAQWDTLNTVDVVMTQGTPTTTSDDDVIGGANTVLIGDEIIQFATATPLGGNSYRLSRLLRGLRGTDGNWGSHQTNDRVVFLDSSVIRVSVDFTLRGKDVLLKAVTANQTLASTTPNTVTISGDEFKCYAPCTIKGSRDGGNNLTITWFRRDRKYQGLQDNQNEPMSETTEAYEVDIYNGLTVVRTLSGLSSPTASYTAAQQTTDFGSPQPSVVCKVYQLGRYGRGYPGSATV